MNFKTLLAIGLISITTVLLSSSLCNDAYASGQMIADAGVDQIANEHTKVSLDGSMSNDPGGQEFSYMWTQISGEPVVLSSASSVTPSFTSPTVANNEIKVLVFELKVFDDNGRESVDTVTITVDPVNTPTTTPTPTPTTPTTPTPTPSQDSTIFIVLGIIVVIGIVSGVIIMKIRKHSTIQSGIQTDDTQVWK